MYAWLFVLKIQREMEDAKSVDAIPYDGIPALTVSLNELAKLELDPHEGFGLSRINGEWSVRSILKICPIWEYEALIIPKRLRKKTLIELQYPLRDRRTFSEGHIPTCYDGVNAQT